MGVVIVVLGLVSLSLLGGYALGRFHERQAQTEATERMSRIDPGSRTPGLPTNRSGEPSEVRKARMWR